MPYSGRYDPYSAFGGGIGRGLDYISQFRGLQQEAELAPLRKEMMLLNLDRAKQEAEERRALPGILERLFQARYVPPGAEDIGGRVPPERAETEVPSGMSLADLRRQMRGAETYEEVMGAIGPQEFATLQRVAPFALEGLRTREQQGEVERKKEAVRMARMYGEAGFDALTEGRTVEGLASLGRAEMALDRPPKVDALVSAIKTGEDRKLYGEAMKRIGPLAKRLALEGDRKAAGELLDEAYALPPSLDGVRKWVVDQVNDAAGRMGDPKVAQAHIRYHELRKANQTPLQARDAMEREHPSLVQAMHRAKLFPGEWETAEKLAGMKPSAKGAIKTLDNEGIQIAHGIAAREGFSLEQRATLSAFLTTQLNSAKASGTIMKPEEFERKLRAEVSRMKGVPAETALPPEEAKKARGWWQSVLEALGISRPGEAAPPTARPAPGRPQASATPPPARQTREAAMAELTRLVDLGMEQEEAEALMRRAGWGGRAEAPAIVTP